MSSSHRDEALVEALDAIVQGRMVKRGRHELLFEGRDVTGLFLTRLAANGYERTTVDRVPCEPGERIPAFYIDNGIAWFGWTFWEFFTPDKKRKLWGSVVKNRKGDWSIQLTPRGGETIWSNSSLKISMDGEHLVVL